MKRVYAFGLFVSAASLSFLCHAAPVKLPAGMSVPLELQHHINSGYVPVGSPIYFRVAKDVRIDDHVLIRAGTLVLGKMDQAQKRGMVGRSGNMAFSMHTVTAVDGTTVPIEADLVKQGRSRAGATVAWTLVWGIPGLITKGVDPYVERGTEVDAIVVAEAIVDPEKAVSAEVLPEIGTVMDIEKYKFGNSTSADIKFDIEREKDLKQMTFEVKPVAGIADLAGALKGLKLIAVDGVAAPESVAAVSATSHSATFDGWSILRFCRDGETTLRFRGTNGSGETVDGSIQMHVKIKKKA
jgi:hypothetical protein